MSKSRYILFNLLFTIIAIFAYAFQFYELLVLCCILLLSCVPYVFEDEIDKTTLARIVATFLAFFSIFGLVFILGMQLSAVIQTKSFEFTFNMNYIFFDLRYYFVLLIMSSIICLQIVVKIMTPRHRLYRKRAVTKEEKNRHTRLATEKEMIKGLKLVNVTTFGTFSKKGSRNGLPILTKKSFAGKCMMYCDGGDTHSLVIGTTASGKSFTFVLPMIEGIMNAGESLLVTDPKGELYEYVASKLKDAEYDVYSINFVRPDSSDGWNPFELAWKDWEKAVKEFNEGKLDESWDIPNVSSAVEKIRDIAYMITYDGQSKEPFFNNSAADIIVGASCLLCEEGQKEFLNFKSIKQVIDQGEEEIFGDHLINAFLKNNRKLDDNSVRSFAGFLSAEDATRASILSVFGQKLGTLVQNENIIRMLSHNTIDLEKIAEKKTAIFLIVHDEKTTYHPLVTLFVKQLYETLVGCSRKTKGRLNIGFNFILDEFGVTPPLKDIIAILAAARSRGIRLTMIIQDLEQLVEKYGKSVAESIKSNVMNTVYLLSGSAGTHEEISKLVGRKLEWNYDDNKWMSVPIMTPERLQKLQMGEAVFIRQRKLPFYTRLLPYDAFPFYKEKNFDYPIKPKKAVKAFNLREAFLSYRAKERLKQNTEDDIKSDDSNVSYAVPIGVNEVPGGES